MNASNRRQKNKQPQAFDECWVDIDSRGFVGYRYDSSDTVEYNASGRERRSWLILPSNTVENPSR